MNHNYICDHNIAEMYVTGKLPAQEAWEFELHFVLCPSCIALLADTRALYNALRLLPTVNAREFARTYLNEEIGWFAHGALQRILLLVFLLLALILALAVVQSRKNLNRRHPTRTAIPSRYRPEIVCLWFCPKGR
jgi:anti-sigma factor RsiW